MPRAFSSGALSIWSNATNCTFGLCFASTFVMAAVSVVFPWSTCPIVPMFTCGFERSNFSFDIFLYPRVAALGCLCVEKKRHRLLRPVPLLLRYSLNFCDDFLGYILGRLIVALEVHGGSRAALGC